MKENYVSADMLEEVISKCNFVPSSRKVLITINEVQTENDIELVSNSEMTIDDWQFVIANGKNSEYQAGQKVYLDLTKLVKRVPNPVNTHAFIEKIDIHPFQLNDFTFALLDDSVIAGAIDETEQPDIKA